MDGGGLPPPPPPAQTFPEALQALLSHSSLLDVPTRCVDRAHFANGTFIVSGSPSACCQGDGQGRSARGESCSKNKKAVALCL